jgi:AraC-like DNA-binding protein
MDVLSNVLNVTQLATHVIGTREFQPPFGINVHMHGHSAVHIVRRGSCWLRRPNAEPIRLNAGDIVLLANGEPHSIGSDRDGAFVEDYGDAIARAQSGVVPPKSGVVDTTQESAVLQCAGYSFSQEEAHPLLTILPSIIRIPADAAAADVDLQTLVRLLTQEATRRESGNELVLPRLIDCLFVYILRSWLREQPEGTGGWLGALRDTQIRKALTFIHEAPQHPWTVESLAKSVAMSRAAFARRFTELVGEPPLAYVTRWRMDLAAKLLRESRDPVARIAGKVGYISETAFAKAFRRRRNMAPGRYRFGRLELERAAQSS